MLTKFQCAREFLIFGRSPKQVIAYISPWTLCEVWLKSDENCWRSSVSEIVESEILQSALNDPKLNSKNLTLKVSYICALWYPECPKFCPFRSAISRFQDIPHLDFPIDPHVKISKCHKFLADHQNIYNVISPYDCLIYHKAWLRSDKNCRRSSVLKCPAPYGPVLTKMPVNKSAIKFVIFGKSPKHL